MGSVCTPQNMNFSEIKVNHNNNIFSDPKNIIENSTSENPTYKEELKHKFCNKRLSKIQKLKNELNINEIEEKLKHKDDYLFNYPELEEDVGVGLKKIRGYISTKSLFEIKDEREKFWENQKEGDIKVWKELKNICDDESITDEEIKEKLDSLEVIPLYDCINVCIDINKNIYEIPNYCIQNPSEYNLEIQSDHNRPSQDDIDVNVSYLKKNFSIKMSNVDTILDVKAEILNMDEFKKVDDNCISLFYKEKELDDNKEIWNYNINNDSTIKLIVKDNNNK